MKNTIKKVCFVLSAYIVLAGPLFVNAMSDFKWTDLAAWAAGQTNPQVALTLAIAAYQLSPGWNNMTNSNKNYFRTIFQGLNDEQIQKILPYSTEQLDSPEAIKSAVKDITQKYQNLFESAGLKLASQA